MIQPTSNNLLKASSETENRSDCNYRMFSKERQEDFTSPTCQLLNTACMLGKSLRDQSKQL